MDRRSKRRSCHPCVLEKKMKSGCIGFHLSPLSRGPAGHRRSPWMGSDTRRRCHPPVRRPGPQTPTRSGGHPGDHFPPGIRPSRRRGDDACASPRIVIAVAGVLDPRLRRDDVDLLRLAGLSLDLGVDRLSILGQALDLRPQLVSQLSRVSPPRPRRRRPPLRSIAAPGLFAFAAWMSISSSSPRQL